MAKLSRFRQDTATIESGEWVTLPDWDDLRIKTRGFTHAYKDGLAQKRRRAAMGFGGDESKIPSGIFRALLTEALIQYLLLDVADLIGEDGQPVTFEAFCGLLRNPDYEPLVLACIEAAGKVGKQQGYDLEEAAGPLGNTHATN